MERTVALASPAALSSRDHALSIYFDVLASDIPDIVATRYLKTDAPLVIRDDLIFALCQVLELALLGRDDTSPWAKPELIVNPQAWAYSLLSARVAFAYRDVMTERNRLSVLSVDAIESVLVANCLSTDGDDEHQDIAPESLPFSTRNSSGLRRLHLQAEHMRAFLGLPQISAPLPRQSRDRLLELTAVSPGLIIDSLDRVSRGITSSCGPFDSIWGLYSTSDAQRLLSAHPRSINLLVSSALSPRTRPGIHVLRAHRQTLRSKSSRRGWPTLVNQMQQAWLLEYFSSVPDKGPRTSCRHAEAWGSATQRAIHFPGSPLGSSEFEIDETMSAALDHL